MKLNSTADVYAKGVGETLTYLELPSLLWRNIRTNNILERLNREIRRRNTGCWQLPGRRIGPDACLRQAETPRIEGMGTKRHLNMKHLYELEKENELKREQEKIGKKGNVA